MRTKFYLLLIAFVATVGSVWAANVGDTFQDPNGPLRFTVLADGNTVQVAANGTKNSASFYSGDIVVPATVVDNVDPLKTYNVVGVGFEAFRYNVDLTSVVLPEGITYLSNGAFRDCSNLKTINFPEGLITFEYGVFAGCTVLESFILPNSVVDLGDTGGTVFSNCKNIKNVTLSKNMTVIRPYTFNNCHSLNSVTIKHAENVVLAENAAFRQVEVFNPITVYVPHHLLESYKATPEWTALSHIILEADPTETAKVIKIEIDGQDITTTDATSDVETVGQLVLTFDRPMHTVGTVTGSAGGMFGVPVSNGNTLEINYENLKGRTSGYSLVFDNFRISEFMNETIISTTSSFTTGAPFPYPTTIDVSSALRSATITTTFSLDMDVTEGTVEFVEGVGSVANTSWDGTKYTISLSGLTPETTYKVNFSGFKSTVTEGGKVAFDFEQQFVTNALPVLPKYSVTIESLAGITLERKTAGTHPVDEGGSFGFGATADARGYSVIVYVDGTEHPTTSDNFYLIEDIRGNKTVTFKLVAGTYNEESVVGGITINGEPLDDKKTDFPEEGKIVITFNDDADTNVSGEVIIDGKEVPGTWGTDSNGNPTYTIDYAVTGDGEHTIKIEGFGGDGETHTFTTGGGSGNNGNGGKIVIDGSTPDLGGGFPPTGEIVVYPPVVTYPETPTVTIDGETVTGSWEKDEDGKDIYVVGYDDLEDGEHTIIIDGEEFTFEIDGENGNGGNTGGGGKVVIDGSSPDLGGGFPPSGEIVIYPPVVTYPETPSVTIDGKEVSGTWETDEDGKPIYVIDYKDLEDGEHTIIIDGEEFIFEIDGKNGNGGNTGGGGKVVIDDTTPPNLPGEFPGDGEIVVYPPVVTYPNIPSVTIDGKEVVPGGTWGTDDDGKPIFVIEYEGLEDGEHTIVVNGKEYTFTVKNGGATSNDVLSVAKVTASYGTVTIDAPKSSTVYVVSLSGSVVYNAKVTGTVTVNVPAGIYVVVVDGTATKIVVR